VTRINMNISEFNKNKYQEFWADLNQRLKTIEVRDGLAGALEALRAQQRDQGFIRDELDSVRRYKLCHPEDTSRFFFVQYNPLRLERFRGLGRTSPPPGVTSIHNGCFLCPENIRWQQCGVEVGYEIELNSRPYVAWTNAYPLMPMHVVVATRDHIPQAWSSVDPNSTQFDCGIILRDLVSLSRKLPGYVGFYNGVGAGASVLGHFHYQFMKRLQPETRFPLEMAPKKQNNNAHATIEDYPVKAVCWQGAPGTIVDQAVSWMHHWILNSNATLPSPSANIFAIADDMRDHMDVYVVPRDQTRSYSSEMRGMIGGLEVLGELVFSSDDEKRRLDLGQVDYHTVERVLSAVQPHVD